jgi:hypothetical protein
MERDWHPSLPDSPSFLPLPVPPTFPPKVILPHFVCSTYTESFRNLDMLIWTATKWYYYDAWLWIVQVSFWCCHSFSQDKLMPFCFNESRCLKKYRHFCKIACFRIIQMFAFWSSLPPSYYLLLILVLFFCRNHFFYTETSLFSGYY